MKMVDQAAMDVALANIADNGDMLHLVSEAPTVYADVATYSLGSVALIPGDGNGSYLIQAGVVSGRRLTMLQQTVPGTAEGVADPWGHHRHGARNDQGGHHGPQL